jgi:8-hydroxy-5-deazaflavin:NADPH oxidoreductase
MEKLLMKIAVIGTGNVGRALGSSFASAGHEVTFAARDAGKTQEIAKDVGARAAASPADAASGADVVVLAVPFGELADVAASIRDEVDGKIVIDVSNVLKSDFSGLALETGSGAERVAKQLPKAHVAKAFNTIFSGIQGNPEALGTTLDALYAVDDDRSRETLAELIGSAGFRPVHVGPLTAARELESLGWLNIRLQLLTNGDWRSSFVLVGAPAAAVAAPVAAATA